MASTDRDEEQHVIQGNAVNGTENNKGQEQ